MQEPKAFAYSLSQQQEGWAWSIYDENGATVACGAHRSRADAEAAVDSALRRNASGVTEDATA